MSNEPNKPIPAQELSEEELEGLEGGTDPMSFIETRNPIID